MKKMICMIFVLMLTGCKRENTIKTEKQIYEPGTYEEVGDGEYGEIQIEVELSENKIESIKILSSNDTNAILDDVRGSYIPDIIALQNTEIDTVSGATGSCKGVHDALVKILEEHQYEKITQQD